MTVHHLHQQPYLQCLLQVIAIAIAIARSTEEVDIGEAVCSATLVVNSDIEREIRSVMRRKGIRIHVLHRDGVGVVAIVIVGMEGEKGKAEGDRGSVSTSLTTVTAASGKRVSGNTKKVTIRG